MPYAPKPKKVASRPKGAMPKGGGKGSKGEKLYTPVKQSTIDSIKKMGMTAALAKAGKTAKGSNAEFIQGVTRMYGAKRVAAARAKAAPAAKSADAARASYAKSKSGMPGAGPSARMATKAAAKKTTSAKADWRKSGIGPVIKKNIKSGDWRKKGLLG
jgi:hypothetical protein